MTQTNSGETKSQNNYSQTINRFGLVVLLIVSFGLGIMTSHLLIWHQKQSDYDEILANCYSDDLLPLSQWIGVYVKAHEKRLPSLADLSQTAMPSKLQRLLTTGIQEGRFMWNQRMGEAKGETAREKPIVWCSPARHKFFSAVVIQEPNGDIVCRIVSVNDLASLISTELVQMQ